MFKDTQFFECEKDCAVFVALERLLESHNASVITKPSTSANSGGSGNKKPMNLHKQKSVEQQQKQIPFRLYDRVMAFDDDGGMVNGTVKWIGGRYGIPGKLIGIETVSAFICI